MLNQSTTGPLRTIHTLHSATSIKCSPLSVATSLPSTTKALLITRSLQPATKLLNVMMKSVQYRLFRVRRIAVCKTCTDIFAVPDLMSERPKILSRQACTGAVSVSGSTKTGKRKKLHETISTYIQVHWLARFLKLQCVSKKHPRHF